MIIIISINAFTIILIKIHLPTYKITLSIIV